jgi:hypothetical protein
MAANCKKHWRKKMANSNTIQFTNEQLKTAINKLELLRSVEKYKRIMEMLDTVNVAKSDEFQRLYNGFYRVRSRQKEWYDVYYNFMQNKKGAEISFEDVLSYLHKKTGRVEASFSSKLLHTLRPDFPTWDKWIGIHTGIKIPAYNANNRIAKVVEQYSNLVVQFNVYKKSENGRALLKLFDKQFPNSGITDIKKIDLVLWQIR